MIGEYKIFCKKEESMQILADMLDSQAYLHGFYDGIKTCLEGGFGTFSLFQAQQEANKHKDRALTVLEEITKRLK